MLIVLYLISLAAFIFEEDFRKLIRYLYGSLSSNKISFQQSGKYFHFASGEFLSATCMFFLLLFVLIKNKKNLIINLILVWVIFCISTILFCFLDGFGKLAECTACDDGTRILTYNEINYDLIFILSLTLSLLPMIIVKFIQLRKIKSVCSCF